MKAGGEYACVDCNLSDDIFFSRYDHGRTGRTIAASPETYWNLWYMYLPLLPIAPYGAGLGFPIVHKSCKPHPSQMKLARLIAWLKNGKLLKDSEKSFLHRSQPQISWQHAPANERAVYGLYVGVRRTMAVKSAMPSK